MKRHAARNILCKIPPTTAAEVACNEDHQNNNELEVENATKLLHYTKFKKKYMAEVDECYWKVWRTDPRSE